MDPSAPTLLRLIPDEPSFAGDALRAAGWLRQEIADHDSGGIVSVWDHAKLAATFTWVSDELTGCDYFIIGGPGRNAACAALGRTINTVSSLGLLNAMGTATDTEQMGAIARKLGLLACGPFDLPVFRVLTGLLHCRDPRLQEQALIAVGYTSWREFDAALSRLIDDDASTRAIRAEAQRLLDALESSDWNAAYRAAAS